MNKLRIEIERDGQWKGKPSIYECGFGVQALCYDKKVAKEIVVAVNNHADLLAACRELIDHCETNACWDKVGQSYYKAKKAVDQVEGK